MITPIVEIALINSRRRKCPTHFSLSIYGSPAGYANGEPGGTTVHSELYLPNDVDKLKCVGHREHLRPELSVRLPLHEIDTPVGTGSGHPASDPARPKVAFSQ